MLRFFRITSVLEGISYLAILSITLGVVSRDFVSLVGMVHGVLFLLYFVLSMSVSEQQRWTLKIWLPLLFASVVPFAFILVEMFLRRSINAEKKAQSVER
ncbi:MAG: hypothetical protein COB04_15170 [Gammaproteobacteria bacterium]|nr:MAG: hypothetical protein COB04_15170 [Gammaproteobacteria bacterium]